MPLSLSDEHASSRWLNLEQAIAHVQTAAKCSLVGAQHQLKLAIADTLIPKWADSNGSDGAIDSVEYLRGTQFVLSGGGLAWDDFRELYRPLLLLRSAVRDLWNGASSNVGVVEESTGSPRISARPKAATRTSDWLTLVQAAEHIQLVEDCDSVAALQQLMGDIGDGIVSVKWANQHSASDLPDVSALAQSQLVLTGPGFAPDPDKKFLRRTVKKLNR
jgi:hypothetical protein